MFWIIKLFPKAFWHTKPLLTVGRSRTPLIKDRYFVSPTPSPGPSRATAGPGKHFHGAPLVKNFLWIFRFKWYILAYFIFLADGGAPKRRGARGSLPLPHPLDGPESYFDPPICFWVRAAGCRLSCVCVWAYLSRQSLLFCARASIARIS